MQRRAILIASAMSAYSVSAMAQSDISDARQTGRPPQQIDILAPPVTGGFDPLAQELCKREQEQGRITGEIVVCGDREENTTDGSWNRQRWQNQYARESAYINDPQAPNVAGPGIFRGRPSVSGLCILNKCPDPPAILIDIENLPPPPDESDAERIAQGLAPRGYDGERGEDYTEEELGLPPRPVWSDAEESNRPEG